MDLEREIIKKVTNTISRNKMLVPGDRVVVAVSGGGDSVCLLDVLSRLKDLFPIDLVVAHFDHGLRPGEDETETQLVSSLAESLSLSFETGRAGAFLRPGDPSLEERARDTRYRFLEEVKTKTRAQKIALGHHLNDQAETVLMRLLRGSGPSGLAGMAPFRDKAVIRPLIELTREEIEGYLEKRKLPYVSDPSNLDTRFMRNSIRLELLQQLKKYQPRIVEILGKTAEIMRRDEAWFEERAEAWIREFAENEVDEKVSIPLSPFAALVEPEKARVIRQALRRAGGNLRAVGFRHVEAINRMAVGKRPQARIDLPNGVTVSRIYKNLIFSRKNVKTSEDFCYPLRGMGEFHLKAAACTITLEKEKGNSPDLGGSPRVAYLDADCLTHPLKIRNFRPGDRFVPLGMKGRKKVKDFFVDLKIPFEARKRTPILTCGKALVWVCGLRIDDGFKVTPKTKRILKVSFEKEAFHQTGSINRE